MVYPAGDPVPPTQPGTTTRAGTRPGGASREERQKLAGMVAGVLLAVLAMAVVTYFVSKGRRGCRANMCAHGKG